MKSLRSIERKTLVELLRMFADPESTARRYARYRNICWAGTFACAIATGIVSAITQTDDAKIILTLSAGVFIGFSVYFGTAAKQVAILTRYCSLNVEAAQKQVSEDNK